MHVQIQPYNFSLITTVKLYIFALILWERVWRLGNNLPNITDFNNLLYSNRFPHELVVLTILMFIWKYLPFIVFTVRVWF